MKNKQTKNATKTINKIIIYAQKPVSRDDTDTFDLSTAIERNFK